MEKRETKERGKGEGEIKGKKRTEGGEVSRPPASSVMGSWHQRRENGWMNKGMEKQQGQRQRTATCQEQKSGQTETKM